MSETFANGRVTLYCGDCIEALATLPAASIDSVVCDPPYHLTAGKKGGTGEASLNLNSPAGRSRISTGGFMGKCWDGGDVAFRPETWAAVLRIIKPGAHLVAFGGSRTYHRMACAIEDAGIEVRDTIAWIYGSGFPKSHDVSKAIDRKAGAVRKVVGEGRAGTRALGAQRRVDTGYRPQLQDNSEFNITAPATTAARQWQGFGTALKPAFEPIILARKPLAPGMTIAGNVLAYGTGALNVDGCRIEHVTIEGGRLDVNPHLRKSINGGNGGKIFPTENARRIVTPHTLGRWPANLVHDGSDEVLKGFPEAPGQQRSVGPANGNKSSVNVYGDYGPRDQFDPRGDSGSAARFFYTAKADADDRLGSKHPTIKPIDLMQWLVRLVTPPGGVVLDCFAGTGTTGEAAFREGFSAVLIEREAEYQADIRRRMSLLLSGKDSRRHEAVKASGKAQDAGPLFAHASTEAQQEAAE